MPKQVEEGLRKRIRSFFWGDKHSPIKEEMIYVPIEHGGQGVLDIRARNEAIQTMWVKDYLKLENRPLWTFFADRILARNGKKSDENMPIELKNNMFLQSWRTKLNGTANTCPKELSTMISTALKHGVRLEALRLSETALNDMPIWYHARENTRIRQAATSSASICLRKKHKVSKVGEAVIEAAHLNDREHKKSKRCKCQGCTKARSEYKCSHPDTCFRRAKQLLDALPQKWDPRRANEGAQRADVNREGWETFNKETAVVENLQDAFRIFTEGMTSETLGQNEQNLPQNTTRVATDGSCLKASTTSAAAGAGIYYGLDDARNRAVRVPRRWTQTNQTGEMTAVLEAVKNNQGLGNLEIESDSRYAINSLTKNLANLENTGYIGKANKTLIRLTVAKIRESNGTTHFKWIKGHNGHAGNEAADKLADEGARKEPNDPDEEENIAGEVRLTGARLSNLTQSLAYKAIREIALKKEKHQRERSKKMIDIIQNHVEEALGEIPTEERIWRSIRHKDISRQARYYLWMAAHDAYRIGTHWLKPNYKDEIQQRSECVHCNGVIEDMSHILSRCETPGQEEVWTLAKKLWEKTGRTWSQPWIGNVIACALTKASADKKERDPGGNRLWRILISESAYLIWKLRCERVIQNGNTPYSTQEVNNRWLTMINNRLELDRDMTDENLGKRKVRVKAVLETWKGALREENRLPRNWIKTSGVLVGIGPRSHQEEG
ncbi:hypothetical protein PLEOSDRAFT_1031451 [Pleurotus ostreatus PC15]|uniref:ribonuclease H n=1 Tax=Pleurotus ostreatus (strain PC15) TaxID=1137138 RepID=A0A067PBC7_PLEO1|nr:hypothetical protein PLEOSDRAFT_1031451 [Pleurotus ostreatus PC15]